MTSEQEAVGVALTGHATLADFGLRGVHGRHLLVCRHCVYANSCRKRTYVVELFVLTWFSMCASTLLLTWFKAVGVETVSETSTSMLARHEHCV